MNEENKKDEVKTEEVKTEEVKKEEVKQEEKVEVKEEVPPVQPVLEVEDVDTVGGGKRFLALVFFIMAGAFIFFLPDLSQIINAYKTGTYSGKKEVVNGVLKCSMESKGDDTNIEYEYTFDFKNKKLLASTFSTIVHSEDKNVIVEKDNKCKKISECSESVTGLDVSCSTSDNVSTMVESVAYNVLKTDNITAFTEAGGEYPEFKFEQNIDEIKDKMVKTGYDCTISANTK